MKLTLTLIVLFTCSVTFAQEKTPWETIQPWFEVPEKFRDDFGSFRSVLQFRDGRDVQTVEEWQSRRQELRTEWMQLLGPWPPLITNPNVKILSEQKRDDVRQLQVRFNWAPDRPTTGWLLLPPGDGPHPAVLTVYYEPDTAVGDGRPNRDFAWQLAKRGFVTLSIGTTETTEAKTYSMYYPDIDDAQLQPLSMLACAAANSWHVLASRPEVDANRIGIVGHSYGGKWALFAGALFDRFAAVAVSDPGIVFDDHPSVNYWEPWYLGWHAQPWRKRGVPTADNPARGLYPKLLKQGRDLHELHSLIAPRPFLVSGGEVDPPERWQALNHTVRLNELLGHEHRVGMHNRPHHAPNAESNAVIYAFFQHFLMPGSGVR